MTFELVFEKGSAARFLSHLEVARAIERAVRRAGLPVEYSAGYNPRPRVAFVAPLPVGVSGSAERAFVTLTGHCIPREVASALARHMPPGFRVVEVAALPPGRKPDFSRLDTADYEVTFDLPLEPPLEQRVADLLARERVEVVRRRGDSEKIVDIRPFILSAEVASPTELHLTLACGQESYASPTEVLRSIQAYKEGESWPRIHRRALYRRSGRP